MKHVSLVKFLWEFPTWLLSRFFFYATRVYINFSRLNGVHCLDGEAIGMQLLRRYRERKLQSTPEDSIQEKKHYKKPCRDNHKTMAVSLPCTPLPKNPASPHMSNESMRIASFRFNGIWDYTKVAATPEQLATAGFYFLGHSDRVQCYYCNGALESWDYGDDPWVEHTKWYPCCEYVLCKKGADFVAGIVSRYPNITRPDPHKIRNAPPEAFLTSANPFITNPHSSRNGIIDPQTHRTQQERRVQNAMDNSPHVKKAFELGIDECKIRVAMKRHFQIQDTDFTSLDDLLDALDHIDENIQSDVSSHSRTVTDSDSNRSSPTNSERECKICYDNEADIVFLPCGHLTTCAECATRVRSCPICRSHIHNKIKTYTS